MVPSGKMLMFSADMYYQGYKSSRRYFKEDILKRLADIIKPIIKFYNQRHIYL